jgi:hypothetical protein
MVENGPLRFHAVLGGPDGPRFFIVVNLFKGPPLLLISYPIFALYSFNLCKKNPNL